MIGIFVNPLRKSNGEWCYYINIAEVPTIPFDDGGDPKLTNYVRAFNAALEAGRIKEPGEYVILSPTPNGRNRVMKITK